MRFEGEGFTDPTGIHTPRPTDPKVVAGLCCASPNEPVNRDQLV